MFIKSKNVYVSLNFISKYEQNYNSGGDIEINDTFFVNFKSVKNMDDAFDRIIQAHQTGEKFVDISDLEK